MNNRPSSEREVDTTIELIEQGPMIVRGSFEMTKIDGTKVSFTPQQMEYGVVLCRCGRSVDKPFCDGSHSRS